MKRSTRRRCIVLEALESRTLLSTASAGLVAYSDPTPQYVDLSSITLHNGSLSSGTLDINSAGTITYAGNGSGTTLVLNNGSLSSGTLHIGGISNVSLQSSGTTSVFEPPTLTVTVASKTFTPVSDDSADGGTITVYLPGTITVLPANFTITGGLGNPTLGAPFTPLPTGTIDLYDGATRIASSSLTNGQTTFQPVLTAGIHSLTADYSGDTYYGLSNSASLSQTVTGIPTSLQVSAPATSLTLGNSITLTITASSNSAGEAPPDSHALDGQNISIYDQTSAGMTKIGSATVVDGAASFSFTPTIAGTHSLHASFSQTQIYAASTSPTLALTVDRNAVSLQLNLFQDNFAVRFGAYASGPDSIAAAPTGSISFYDGPTFIRTVAFGNQGSLTLAFTAGSHVFIAKYSGDATFQPSTTSTLFNVQAFPPSSLFVNASVANAHLPIGHLDIASSTRIAGWTLDHDAPKTALHVSLYLDGKAVAYSLASVNRFDLTRPYGSANHGFDFTLPALAPGQHHITVFATDFSGTTITLASRTITSANTVRGFIDILSPTRIAGWAYSPAAPDAAIQIRIDIDGIPGTTVSASTPRGDLTSLPTTAHAFDLATPSLSPGQHVISIYLIDPLTKNPLLLVTNSLVFS